MFFVKIVLGVSPRSTLAVCRERCRKRKHSNDAVLDADFGTSTVIILLL
jgi:hypothetical protein